ncbi:hypothetical protein B0J11DRAFT_423693 [Dendryphion nanum]|uniref:Uncharacterized protein n=1 Tax=Dendryphion nanum TaxID=256645 RepID=A0A9P9EJ19_9PLEO|nr:hypothetical protein B0J11DRAFT_423693 [Dendryphion nanum]
MFSALHLSTVIVSISSMHTTLAVPASESRSVPEVIPGAGLPSLKSLGLTSEYLYSLPKPELNNTEMRVMVDGVCGPDYAYTNVNDAIACFHYLNNLGTTLCTVSERWRSEVFCTSGIATIEVHGRGQSSWCKDVAWGALWSIDHCTRPQQDVAGESL